MQGSDEIDEQGQSTDNSAQRLAWDRLGIEDNKVNRMPFQQRHPDLGIALEPSDTRAMPSARIHDHDRGSAPADVALKRISAATRYSQ